MPKSWYERSSAGDEYADKRCTSSSSIVADKKPYFMRYIYPTMMRQYNTYIKNTNKKAIREFKITIDELLTKEGRSEEEENFIRYYREKMPVGVHDCVMNKICRRFEQEFDGYIARNADCDFDYTIMKGNNDYTSWQYDRVSSLYREYVKRMKDFSVRSCRSIVDKDESNLQRNIIVEEFMGECLSVCSNSKQLCDIILDVCYNKESSKQFAWDMVGGEIIENLLSNNNWCISFPSIDPSGDILFSGERFSFLTRVIGGECE